LLLGSLLLLLLVRLRVCLLLLLLLIRRLLTRLLKRMRLQSGKSKRLRTRRRYNEKRLQRALMLLQRRQRDGRLHRKPQRIVVL
jgi:hypothetical protein